MQTAELEKQRIASKLRVDTNDVVICAIENRKPLLASIKDATTVPAAVASMIGMSQ